MTPLGPQLAMGAIVLAAAAPAAGGTCYVNNANPACSDTGPGSQATPYCTISAAVAAQHLPGTTILVMPGVYREQVNLTASGTSASPIVLQAQDAPLTPVVVDGSDDFSKPGLWVPYAEGVWVAASVTWSPKQVFADGGRLVSSAAAPAALPLNAFTWSPGSGLYVNIGGDNPGLHQLLVGHRLFAIHVTGCSWVVISQFATTHCEWSGFEIDGASTHVTVTDCSATFENNYGIQVDSSTVVQLTSCVTSDNLWSGIGLTNGSTNSTVLNSESFQNLTPNQANGIYGFGAPGNIFQGNRVHDNAYNGIFMSRGANNSVLIQNRSWNNDHHGIEDLSATGNLHVGDVSWGNTWNGFAIEGGAVGTTLYDCIATSNAPLGFTANLEVDTSSALGFTSNDNLFWDPAGRPLVIFNGSRYQNVADFAAATGQDTRTIQADPRFSNPGAGDFSLEPDSPAIDNANSGVPRWPSSDAEGRPRRDDLNVPNTGLGPVSYADRGALEYQPDGTEPVRPGRRFPAGSGPDDDADDVPPSARGLSVAAPLPGGQAMGVIPNPVSDNAILSFTLARPGPVSIRVYDLQSRVVRTIRNLPMGSAGRNVVNLDARDDDGVVLRPGVYLYEIRSGAERASGRFAVTR